jgi:transcriptional regulator with XRE-family HTH domain
MTDGPTGSTVPRRQLGRHLRELRNRSRLTVRTAARELEWSETKLWRIETGQTSLRSLDVEVMCRIYGASADLAQGLMALAKETKARGWWHAFGDVIPGNLNLYIGLEDAASELCWYSVELVPGLLQTEDYARTIIHADNARLGKDEVERRVQARVARRALFARGTAVPTVRVALSEAILRRPVGGREVMVRQLEYLLEVTSYPNVSIRVIPFETGLHDGLGSGPFVMMRFPETVDGRETEPPTVYAESLLGALFLDKPHEIDRYDTVFHDIWSSAADEARSASFIHEAAREFRQ